MDHEEVARHIIKGRNTALVPQNAEYLIGEIAEALQNAFDLGFRAAGGTVGSDSSKARTTETKA